MWIPYHGVNDLLIPRYNFEILQVILKLQDLLPPIVPKSLAQEEPVLGIRYFFAEVRVD